MKHLITILLIAVLTLMTSCKENPKSIKLDGSISEMSEKQIERIKSMSKEDQKSLLLYEVRNKLSKTFGGLGLDANTVGEAIDNQKEFIKNHKDNFSKRKQKLEDQEQKLEEQEAEKQALLDSLKDKYSFQLIKKYQHKQDYQTYTVYKIAISNHTNVGIRAISFDMEVSGILGNHITNLGFRSTSTIEPMKKSTDEYMFKYNQFMKRDTSMANVKIADLVVQFKPKKIILTNGEVIQPE